MRNLAALARLPRAIGVALTIASLLGSRQAAGPARSSRSTRRTRFRSMRRSARHAAERAAVLHPPERAAREARARCGSPSRPARSSKPTTSRGSRTSSSTWRSTAARTSSRASSCRTSNRPARGSARTSTPTRASTKRSTCSTCRPTTPEVVAKGFTALADFAGGLTLDPEQVDKERGVVIEEWRGRLGAGIARARQAASGPLLPVALRGAAADRQARDPAHRAGRAAARVLRHLVPPRADGGRRRRRHRSAADRGLDPRRLRPAHGARARPPRRRTRRVPLHRETARQRRADPEITQSSVAAHPEAAGGAVRPRRRLPPDPGRAASSSGC